RAADRPRPGRLRPALDAHGPLGPRPRVSPAGRPQRDRLPRAHRDRRATPQRADDVDRGRHLGRPRTGLAHGREAPIPGPARRATPARRGGARSRRAERLLTIARYFAGPSQRSNQAYAAWRMASENSWGPGSKNVPRRSAAPAAA